MSGWRQARSGPILAAAAVAGAAAPEPVVAVDAWIRGMVARFHPVLGRVVCPFVPPSLERDLLFYAPVRDCRHPEDVVSVMGELIERFGTLPPVQGREAQFKTVVAVFVDIDARDAARVVLAAHPELKDRCTERGMMVGEFAPGYQLASTRNPDLNMGDAPAPILALRHMVPSDRRFLLAEDRWMAAWATRFGAHRVRLFRTFSARELAAIGRAADEMHAEAGRVLCEQGDEGNEFFLIVDGEAAVVRNGKTTATLGPGQYFGELALLTLRPRNATVTAITDMTLLVLGRREFRGVIDAVPSVTHMLLTGLAERLDEADAESVHH
jgi:hypothetical protein